MEENSILYECNKDGWEKFINENYPVEKAELPADPSFLNNLLDVAFKREGRDEFIDFLSKEGYISMIITSFKIKIIINFVEPTLEEVKKKITNENVLNFFGLFTRIGKEGVNDIANHWDSKQFLHTPWLNTPSHYCWVQTLECVCQSNRIPSILSLLHLP